MVEPRQHATFAREPLGKRRVGGQRLRANLEADQPLDSRLPGVEDKTHAALANQFQDFELGKSGGQFLVGWGRRLGMLAFPGLGGDGRLHEKAPGTKPLGRLSRNRSAAFWTAF